ncbi:hypothetical protein AAGG52_11445 [Bacillus licheniformis]
MSDIELRKLVDCIMERKNTAEKISLIRDHFVSLHDYLDLLNSGCLFDDEYNALFATFGNFELAIFAKIVFYEELRGEFSISLTLLLTALKQRASGKHII